MTTEKWLEYPLANEVVSRSQFFDELRDNLQAVIQDYVGLGVENEAQLLAQADQLFRGDLVPSRDDWKTMDFLLHELANVKEIGQLYHNFFADVQADSLGVSDLENIRRFLDIIQTLPPQEPTLNIRLPEPNRPYLNQPTLSSTDGYQTNLTLKWTVNTQSLAIPSASISGNPSPSEDIAGYDLLLEAGNQSWTRTFGPKETINYSLPLEWTKWFPLQDLNKAALSARLTATDKRGNSRTVTAREQYPSGVRIPAVIQKYQVERQINGGSWVRLGETTGTSYTWKPLPQTDGTYRLRVRGLDSLGRTYGGFEPQNNNRYTDWAYSEVLSLKYLPDPPEKPKPTYTSTWNTITIKWQACARADYYEVHNWSTTAEAIRNSTGGNVYYKKVMANESRSVTLKAFSSNNSHGIYVRAVNAGGETVGYVAAKTKARTLHKKTYKQTGTRVWNGMYDFIQSNGRVVTPTNGPQWRSEANTLYQGEWKEVNLGGWKRRGAPGAYYMAYDGQTWGNNMSFIFLDYEKMRRELGGKNIQKVTLRFQRSTAGAHGFPEATPIYLYNHNRYNSTATSERDTPSPFTLYRGENRTAVTYENQKSLANVKFDRGETESISNSLTKQLIQNIVDGHMRGLGIVKYYGTYFNSHTSRPDTAYMRLSGNVSIEVEYYDN